MAFLPYLSVRSARSSTAEEADVYEREADAAVVAWPRLTAACLRALRTAIELGESGAVALSPLALPLRRPALRARLAPVVWVLSRARRAVAWTVCSPHDKDEEGANGTAPGQ